VTESIDSRDATPCDFSACVAGEIQYLRGLLARGGPLENDYEDLRQALDRLNARRNTHRGSHEKLRRLFFELGGPFTATESLIGLTLCAERHGGYEVMHRLYRGAISHDSRLRRWDQFYHSLDAAQAVRSRKDFVVNLLERLAEARPGARVLNVGSGPCDDVLDFFKRCGPALQIDCLDADDRALAFAREQCGDWLQWLRFERQNALFLKPRERYQLVISVGLTDYLSDRLMTRLLHRLLGTVAPGGTVVIGNFGPHKSRGAMACSGWHLIERSPEDLLRLGRAAGAAPERAWVASEQLGIVHFLRCTAARD
jgi:hypothetical protein